MFPFAVKTLKRFNVLTDEASRRLPDHSHHDVINYQCRHMQQTVRLVGL